MAKNFFPWNMSKKQMAMLSTFRHKKRHHEKMFPFVVGLKKRLNLQHLIWLNKNIQGDYSEDRCVAGKFRNLSFSLSSDAILFKMVWTDMTCGKHDNV